jgi:hypothetical protein
MADSRRKPCAAGRPLYVLKLPDTLKYIQRSYCLTGVAEVVALFPCIRNVFGLVARQRINFMLLMEVQWRIWGGGAFRRSPPRRSGNFFCVVDGS